MPTLPDPTPSPALARLDAAGKAYGACRSLDGVSAEFRAGELHVVAGENGAGKSTLLKLLAGHVAPTEGRVELGGAELRPASPTEALARGFALVEQHGLLVPSLTAEENLVLGREGAALGRLDVAVSRARATADAWAERLGVRVPWGARAGELGVVARQWLEILRALARDARLLALDEPTALLGPRESARLYEALGALVRDGRGVVVVTHHLDEIEAHADRVTVLRRGRKVLTAELGTDAGARRSVVAAVRAAILGTEEAAPAGDAPAAMDRPRAPGPALDRDVLALREAGLGARLGGVSLTLSAGEIVGVAGVEGSGQRELVELVVGLSVPSRGRVERVKAPPAGARPAAWIPEDRLREGIVLEASVEDNVLLGDLGRFTARGVVDADAARAEARARLAELLPDVDLRRPVGALSGGNQQKVVLARALAHVRAGAPVLVAAQPTRGLDLGASALLRTRLVEAATAGAGVLLVSHDLEELRALAHRIVVLYRGALRAELPAGASADAIGRAMLGEEAA